MMSMQYSWYYAVPVKDPEAENLLSYANRVQKWVQEVTDYYGRLNQENRL